MNKAKIAVLVSGGGTNLQALLDAQAAGQLPHGQIALVLSSNENAYALTRAAGAGIPARESDVLVRATLPAKKGTGLFWSVLSGETSRSSGEPLSSVAWKSAAFSEVCGKFSTYRAHRGFAITNPQVEHVIISRVVGLSEFCRILPKFRRISLALTAHLPHASPSRKRPRRYE